MKTRKEKRKRKILYRKNFLPTLFLIIILWTIVAAVVYFVDPTTTGIIPIFFLLMFVALLFTLSTAFANTRRGLIFSLALIFFLLLRYFGVGNIINLILIVGIAVAIDFYYSKN